MLFFLEKYQIIGFNIATHKKSLSHHFANAPYFKKTLSGTSF